MYTEEKILCLMCESASLSREQLLEHIYEHLGYRRHACHACDYASSSLEEIMRHGDDQNHATKIFGFRREYLDRVSEIVYKDCIDAQKRGIEAVMKCTVVRGTDDDSKRQRAAVSESSPTANNERRVTTSVPDSTADAVPMSPTKARTSKKSKKGLDNTPSSSSFNRSVKIEVEQSPPPAVCRKCKGKVTGGVDRLRRHAFEHLRNVSWRCSYCMFRTSDSFAKLIKHATRKHPGRKPLDICDCVEDDDAVEVMSRCFPDISRQASSGLAPVVVSSPLVTEERSPPAVVQSSRVAASSFVERRVRRSSSPGRVVSQSTTSPSALADSMSTDGSSSNGTAAHKIFCNECGASVSSLYGAKRSHVAIKHLACDSATEVDDTDATFVQMLSFCFPGTTSLTDLQCMQCGKEYASEGGRQGHVARKHFIRFLQCPFPDCRFRATYTDDISRHIKNEHQRGRGKEQIPREVALRWDWDKKAFQANLLPQVHICFPRPLPDKDRRRPLSPTRVDVAPSDSALLQLMSDVRQSLREDSPESPPPSGRKRYQSEGGAQRVISSTSSISPPITRVNNNASLSSAHHSKTTTTRPLVPSSTRAVQGINNFVSPEAYLPEQAKPIPFLTALRDVDDNTDGVCEVTKEKVKKRRLDQTERPTTTTMTTTAAAQVTTKEGENNDKEPPAKRPLPLLGVRAVSPLLGNCPEDNGSQLPLIIDTSRPPPNWRPASANGHYSPVSLSTEPKFDRPPDAYSPPNNSFPSSHQQSNALSRTTDFSRPTPVYDSLPQRAPLIADSHQHRSVSHGRSQSWNDRQANFGGPPLNRFPHSSGGRSEDHRRQHPPSLGSDNLQCRLCKKTVPESDVERHLWSAHVDAHSYPYKCRICKHPARAVSDILAHASKAHSGCDKSSLLLHTATPSQKAKYEQQKKQCFPNITRR